MGKDPFLMAHPVLELKKVRNLVIWDLKSWHSDNGIVKKAWNFLISNKNEQFSCRNWLRFIVKNSQCDLKFCNS